MGLRGPKPKARDEVLTPQTRAMVEGCHDLAIKLAWDFWRTLPNGAYDISDLISVSTWELVDAGLRWNPHCVEQGYDATSTEFFISFSARSIRGGLLDYCRSENHYSRAIGDEAREIQKLLDIGMTREQVAAKVGITMTKLGSTLAAVAKPRQIDDPDLADEKDRSTIESEADANFLLEAFADIVERMPYNKQAVIALRYYAQVEMNDIARYLNLTSSAVLKLHTDCLTEIRQQMQERARVAS